MDIKKLLKLVIEKSASDLHIVVGVAPYIRVDGELVPVEGETFDSIIGSSDEKLEVKEKAMKVAKYIRETVVIEGRTGTGK